MSLTKNIAQLYPDLKLKLKIAHINKEPELYVKEALRTATFLCIGLTALTFFLVSKQELSMALVPLALVVSFFGIFQLQMKKADSAIRKRAKDIDKEVLFAGQFLLVKLNSGKPLINALMDAASGYGVATKYFKEIVRDIELGTTLEEALEKATAYTPSQKFKKILFQITNALKIGIDVTNFLQAILDEIADEQLIEIQRYGKKLNGLTMFYMLFAVVVPSLGMTLLMVVASLVSMTINMSSFMMILFMLLLIQLVFITMFKAIRPNVHI